MAYPADGPAGLRHKPIFFFCACRQAAMKKLIINIDSIYVLAQPSAGKCQFRILAIPLLSRT